MREFLAILQERSRDERVRAASDGPRPPLGGTGGSSAPLVPMALATLVAGRSLNACVPGAGQCDCEIKLSLELTSSSCPLKGACQVPPARDTLEMPLKAGAAVPLPSD